MRIGVLGTGTVGRALAGRLSQLSHEVAVGTRDVQATLGRDVDGESFAVWRDRHPGLRVVTLPRAAQDAELLVNATSGAVSIAALEQAGVERLDGTVLVDVANALDFSRGMPPSLLVAGSDSLGEQIQRRFPRVRVVKTLNTMNADVMVDPLAVGGGDHTVFVSGDDADAKRVVGDLLASLGWADVIDLGPIASARGPEMLVVLWLELAAALGTWMLQTKIVR